MKNPMMLTYVNHRGVIITYPTIYVRALVKEKDLCDDKEKIADRRNACKICATEPDRMGTYGRTTRNGERWISSASNAMRLS